MTQWSAKPDNQTDQELFPGLKLHQTPEMDTITWSNKLIPKNKTLYITFIISLIILVLLGTFLTLRLVDDLFLAGDHIALSTSELVVSSFFVFVSWIAVAAICYYLLRISWTEKITISNAEMRLDYSGLLAPKEKSFAAHRIWCLSFERVGNERDQESRFTLNIFDIDDKRQTLAYWIRAEENYKLFLLLEKIFEQRGWSVQSRTSYRAG